jgi:hypothetical protein
MKLAQKIKSFFKSFCGGFMYAADCIGHSNFYIFNGSEHVEITEQEYNDRLAGTVSIDGFGYSVKDNAWDKKYQDYKYRKWSNTANDMDISYAKAEGMRNMYNLTRTMKQKRGFYDVYLCNTEGKT